MADRPEVSILCLDKVKKYEAVLDLVIASLRQREKPEYFTGFDLRGRPSRVDIEPRITEQLKLMLEGYKK
jgi:hypothetical protein